MSEYQPGLALGDLLGFNESIDNLCTLSSSNLNQVPDQPGPTKKPKRGYANKRERVRTENVNAGFDKLRKLIPTDPIDRKLSKIEVLRLAVSYINHLYNLTKADSCLEVEHIDECSNRINMDTFQSKRKPHRQHVCTFCLMITKATAPSNSTKKK